MLYSILLVLLVIDSLVLIAAVLLQAGQGGGMAASFGGVSSSASSFLGTRQTGNLLTKASWWCGGLFLGLSFLLVSVVMENMPWFEDYKEVFLTYHFKCWLLVFNQPLPWPRIAESVSIIIATNLTALVIGCAGFHVRDIKS